MNPEDPSYGSYQPPPRRRHRFRNFVVLPLAGILGLIVTLIIIGAALTSGSPHVTPAPSTFGPSSSAAAPQMTTDVNGSSCAPSDMTDGFCPGDSPSPSPSDSLTGPVGTEFTVTSQDNNGNDVKYSVTADKITDPASGADQYTTPDSGKRFVGVEFTVTGISGYSSDDSNSDAIILGDDGQTYSADFDSISAGTNFNSGDFGVRPGQAQVGWVTFQVPRGVKVASVQWQPGLGDQQPATWTK
jgi:hypothetical protein